METEKKISLTLFNSKKTGDGIKRIEEKKQTGTEAEKM